MATFARTSRSLVVAVAACLALAGVASAATTTTTDTTSPTESLTTSVITSTVTPPTVTKTRTQTETTTPGTQTVVVKPASTVTSSIVTTTSSESGQSSGPSLYRSRCPLYASQNFPAGSRLTGFAAAMRGSFNAPVVRRVLVPRGRSLRRGCFSRSSQKRGPPTVLS